MSDGAVVGFGLTTTLKVCARGHPTKLQ